MDSRKRKKKQIISFVIISFFVTIVVCFTFSISFKSIHRLLLEKDIEQVNFTSNFVTKLIETEIENIISDLKVGQKLFLKYDENDKDEVVKQLKNFQTELNFEKMGVSNLEGNCVDSDGRLSKLSDAALLEVIANGKEYISNVMDESDTMLLAVPIIAETGTSGVLWGHYRVESIAEKIELNENSHRYFQIIDDSGEYISDSNNIHSFSKGRNIWSELERYEISDGITAEEIRQNVENGRSGQFHFRYQGAGRYVSYEPLGINNWYVFSVLIEEYLTDYVGKIEKIFAALLWGILVCIVVVIVAIGRSIYKTTAFIKEQNNKLASKNSLLFMVLKHTNDIPFEVNLEKRTIAIYRARNHESAIVESLEKYFPENMLKNNLISEDYYDAYKSIFDNIMHLKPMEAPVVKIKIDGIWDCNKVHYNIMDSGQVIGFLEDYNEQAFQYEQMKKINKKSQLDSLTSLYNRAHFMQEVEKEIQELGHLENVGYSALLLLDLDFFKQANDTLGHMMGDYILEQSARIIKTIVRNTDLCGRLGGDEFVLFIRNVKDLHSVKICAEKINHALHQTYSKEGKSVTVSASIGIAILTTETRFNELYQLADVALYKAKEQGRNDFFLLSREPVENGKDV